MKILIDTHTLIWMDSDPTQLSPTAVACFNDPANEIWLSVVSVWEIVIKSALGKLTLSGDIHQVVQDIQAQNPLLLLDIQCPHALAVRGLPLIHKDPVRPVARRPGACGRGDHPHPRQEHSTVPRSDPLVNHPPRDSSILPVAPFLEPRG